MRSLSRAGQALFVIVSLLAVARCSQSQMPTTPTPLIVVPSPVPGAASVTGVTPSAPARSDVAQLLNVQGAGFQAGQVLVLTSPSGASVTVSGTDIQSLLATSFQVSVMLSEIGSYRIVIRQLNGDASSSFLFNVSELARPDAIIDSVRPASAVQNLSPEIVTLVGRNFYPDLQVQIVDPDSLLIQLDAPHRADETSSLIEFSMTFSKVGTYTISLWTRFDQVSNVVTVRVR